MMKRTLKNVLKEVPIKTCINREIKKMRSQFSHTVISVT